MKNKVLKAVIIMLLIVTLTIADFVLLGTSLVTYALENITNTTSNNNVKFAAYFKTEEEVSRIDYEMNSNEMKLYLEVAVENKGYFDGVVTLENSNFKIKENLSSDKITKIEGNTITLNRVRAGNKAEIELAIEPIMDESYGDNMLSKETTIKLSGKYNNGEEKIVDINAEKKVTLNLTVPANIDTTLERKVLTNRVYKIGEENKRIVQVELNSTVVENTYPIKRTIFELPLPNGAENVEVITKGTYATNGEADRELVYEEDNKVLYIVIENISKDGKIAWNKNVKDNVIVTFMLDAEQEVPVEEYTAKSKVELYGQQSKVIEKELTYNLSEEADGIIRASSSSNEVIYKGKIYSKEEREYNITTNIEVNYANLIDGNTVEERATYRTDVEDKVANIEYKTTTIKKSEIEKILGTEGKLTIQNGLKQEEITSETEADENGNIIITYEPGVKTLQVTVTKAIETGVIRLNHTKVIKAENYSKAEIDEIKQLVEIVDVKYTTAEYTFERKMTLRDVTAEVGLTVIPQTISAEGSREMQIALTLRTDDEKYELFKNPSFLITMPEGVTVKSLSNATISADAGLTISKLEPITQRQIMLEIIGEQQKYVTSDINTQINFTANVNIEKLMPNKVDRIKMHYTNQEKTYDMQSAPINIIASNARIVTNLKIENYNNLGTILQKYSDGTTEVNGKLPLNNSEMIQAPVKYTIINNDSKAITLKASLVADFTDKEENVESIMNYVEEEITIEAGQMKLIEQVLQIPAGLYFSEKIELKSLVEYTYSGTEYSVPNTIQLATEEKEGIRDISIINDKIQLETFMQLGDKTGIKETDEIFNEQIVKYIIEVTNVSNEVVSNLIVKNVQDNGNIYDLKEIEVSNIAIQPEPFIEHRYGELDTNTKVFEIGQLNPGESRELVCKVVVKKSEENNITSANISVLAEGIEETNVKQISNTVKDANLKIASRRALNEEVQIYANSSYLIVSTIKNLTNQEVKDTNVRIHLSEGLTYKENYPINALDENDQELDIIKDITYNKEENYIDLVISNLAENQEITLISMLYIEEFSTEETSKDITVYLEVNDIISNDVISNTKQMETNVTVVQSVNIAEGQKVKNGDKVIITGEIVNIGNIDSTITVQDEVPNGLDIEKVTVIKNGERIDQTSTAIENSIIMSLDIARGETIALEIEATVNTSKIITETIENTIIVKPFVSEEVVSNKIVLSIESTVDTSTGNEETEYEKPEDPTPETPTPETPDPETPTPETPETPDPETPTPETPDPEPEKYTISGTAWVDKNKNNVKDQDELLKDIIVKVVDLNNQNTFLRSVEGNIIEVKTNKNGEYKIENVEKGKYNIIFKYNTDLYELNESSNLKDYIIESTKEKVAITNNINLEENKTIDLELVELTEFNLKIDKYISKVIVQNQKGTKTSEYAKQQLVREEISNKYLSGSTVLVEYTMEISNIGELAGYATEIVDYLPADMKFHSELNTQWYAGEDGNLYNASLATTAIKPGETKTIRLVLLKTMTKNNTGTTLNIAEISETMNIKEYADIDLKDNQSKAEIIVNVATGTIITYIIAIMNSVVIISIGMYMIKKKVIK